MRMKVMEDQKYYDVDYCWVNALGDKHDKAFIMFVTKDVNPAR